MKHRALTLTLAAALAASPAPSEAIAPVLLIMIKQIAQQAATSMIKDTLLSSLDGMGCKGIALSNALAALDMRGGGAGALLGGMPKLPAMPNMPGMPNMAGIPGMPGMPTLPGGVGMPFGGLTQGMAIPPDIAAKMGTMMPGLGQLPPGMNLGPEQMAMMAQMQRSMNEPLSPRETLATIDELFELGFLPKAMQSELKECMVLLPTTIPALGMGMGMIKPMIPQLRQAREDMRALSPAEQDDVAAMLAQELRALPADQRAALDEHLDSGFFPPRVAQGAKAGVGR
jgi:hypothetical protein